MTLYVRGRIPPGGIAIVGSRTPPATAVDFAYRLAQLFDEPIVAGLAPGIDAAAHRGAIARGVLAVAYVGYGFGCTDPPDHAELEAAIVAAGGAVATLLAPGTPVTLESRIERDRLQAKYSRAVVLVCTEIDGGAMHTMRFACELGTPRFAVLPPMGDEDSPAWAGNLRCIADGATPLPFDPISARDLIDLARLPPRATSRTCGSTEDRS